MAEKSSSGDVFELGKLRVEHKTIDAKKKAAGDDDDSLIPPKPLMIFFPVEAGEYPVVVFCHGFLLQNSYYQQTLGHIASHGFILVAPQLNIVMPCSQEDINGAAKTTNWLPNINLHSILPTGVIADLSNLALAGHSRGGHTAFSLALDPLKTTLKYSLLIGIDPVAGPFKSFQIPPKILIDEPASFKLGGMPVMVIGSGLGDKKKNVLFPACAPDGVNHWNFYYNCQPPCYYFVVSEYGHLDMLDNNVPQVFKCVCKNGTSCKDLMRRTIGGLLTAFLKAYFGHGSGDLDAILANPQIAPTKLDPVAHSESEKVYDGPIAHYESEKVGCTMSLV